MNRRMEPIAVVALAVILGAGVAWAEPAGTVESSFKTNLAWQIALDRAGFSPGLLDGSPGRKSKLALWEFQRAHGLEATGKPDANTAAALGVEPEKALTTYTVTAADLDQVDGPLPKKWQEKAKLKRLAYETLDSMLAEKFHCTRGLLEELNPSKSLNAFKGGETIAVPAITPGTPAQGDRIEINFAEKVVRIYAGQKLVGMFHCSIAADKENLPTVDKTSVAVISDNPTYRFDPAHWPEVKDVDQILLIPPGPRNPVGMCWLGLALSGYGIHGTPTPEMIGKTGSHGCFRTANWDAMRLGKMVKVGTPVIFLNAPNNAFAAAGTGASAPANKLPSLKAEVAHPAASPAPAAAPASTPAPVIKTPSGGTVAFD